MKAFTVTFGAALLCSGMLLAQQTSTPSTADTMPATSAQAAGSSWTALLVAATCDASSNMPTSTPMSSNQSYNNQYNTQSYNSNRSYNSNQAYNSNQPYNSADRMSDVTTARRTTPANESNTTYEQNVNQADRNNVASSAANNGITPRGTPTDMNQRTTTPADMTQRTSAQADMNQRTSAQSDMNQRTSAQSDINQRTTASDMNRRTSSNESDMNMRTSGSADRSAMAYNQSNNSQDNGWAQAQEVARQMPDTCRIRQTTSSFALRTPDGQVYVFDEASNNRIQQQLNGHVTSGQMKIFRVVVRGNLQGNTITLDSIQL